MPDHRWMLMTYLADTLGLPKKTAIQVLHWFDKHVGGYYISMEKEEVDVCIDAALESLGLPSVQASVGQESDREKAHDQRTV